MLSFAWFGDNCTMLPLGGNLCTLSWRCMGSCYFNLRFGAVVCVWHDFSIVRPTCAAKKKS